MTNAKAVTVVHVAEAGENRGRIVLRLASATPNRLAIEAALRVARAYQASLEGVFVEDQHIIDLARHEGVVELSLSGADRRQLSAAACMRQYAYAAREAERRISAMARVADIPFVGRTLRDTPLHALNRACAESGPWNVIAFADAIHPRDRDELLCLMDDIADVTGFLLVAPGVRRTHGPIVLVVEEHERVVQLLRIADRLGAETGDQLIMLLSAESEAELASLDHAVRLLLADRPDIAFRHTVSHGSPAALAEAVRRLAAGFVIARAGRMLLPRNAPWIALAQGLDSPLFIAR